MHTKAQMEGRVRARRGERKDNWNDKSSLCGVFMNGNSGRVHISESQRAKVNSASHFTSAAISFVSAH
jgi:hypothetical protein